MNRLRVLLDCRMATFTGVGRYSSGLARGLAARDDVEIVQVLAEGDEPPAPEGERVGIVRAQRHPFDPLGGRELARICRKNPSDLVHCLHFPTPVPASHPIAVTLHDLTPLVMPSVMPSLGRRAVWRWWNGRAARVADLILANSAHTAADIARVFPRARDRVRVVLHAADDFTSGPMGEVPRDLRDVAPYILSMGNVKPNKGLPTLLRAFAAFGREHAGVTLVLVGAERSGYVEGVLGDDPAAARVRFSGGVTDPELRALYRDAVAFAFPSVYEGFGLPPLEAMAFGTPVVCSEAASLPEVVGDAALTFRAGDVTSLAESLGRLIGDAALRARLAEAGVERARAFTWERTTAETVAAYRELIGRGPA